MATFSSEEEKKAEERDIVLVTWQLNDPVRNLFRRRIPERVRERRQERQESVGRKTGRETWTDDRAEKEKRRERSGRRRDDEYITYGGESRFESCAAGSRSSSSVKPAARFPFHTRR